MSESIFESIERVCSYWRNDQMLQDTFAAMKNDFEQESDAVIDSAKSLVEVVCRKITEELDEPSASCLPPNPENATVVEWFASTIKVFGFHDKRDRDFADLVKAYKGIAEPLRKLRNSGGPVSHGKDPLLEKLTHYHRRGVAVVTDSIVGFLFEHYSFERVNLLKSREPYERFHKLNDLVDDFSRFRIAEILEDGQLIQIEVGLSDGNSVTLIISPSQLLFHIDREAYKAAVIGGRSAQGAEEAKEVTR